MRYYSTHNKRLRVTSKEAVLNGLAPDGGLYFPEQIPVFPKTFFEHLHQKSLPEIAHHILLPFFDVDIPSVRLQSLVEEAFNFSFPLHPLKNGMTILELFHGPTCAFKDVGARFMARVMSYFAEKSDHEFTILVATSGDTGSAVANAFLNVPGVRVFVLYPSGRVSHIQEQQLTTLDKNITALEIDGSFDDCQELVKQAFVDPDLRRHMQLSSANSINVARLIPQMIYYFWVWAQYSHRLQPIVISVPCGNFGNLTAGLMAKQMGLPLTRFIAATNMNDVVPEFLETAIFRPRASVATISSAMDVGNPSNLHRLIELFKENIEHLRSELMGFRVTDRETRQTIRRLYEEEQYLVDPHTAVAIFALEYFLSVHSHACIPIALSTAHPAKFKHVVEEEIGREVPLPSQLEACMNKKKQSICLSSQFEDLKQFLLAS